CLVHILPLEGHDRITWALIQASTPNIEFLRWVQQTVASAHFPQHDSGEVDEDIPFVGIAKQTLTTAAELREFALNVICERMRISNVHYCSFNSFRRRSRRASRASLNSFRPRSITLSTSMPLRNLIEPAALN